MPKKEKKRNKRKNKAPIIPVINHIDQGDFTLHKKRSRVWSYINPTVSWITLIIISINLNFYGKRQTDSLLTFFSMFSAPIFILLVVLKMRFTKSLVASVRAKEYENQTRFWRNCFWINVLLLTLTLFPLVYESILIREISLYIAYYLPQLGEIVLGWISRLTAFLASTGFSILGNLLLGVLGNFIYDLLKGRFPKKRI